MTQKTLSNYIGKIDFFASLPAGFYVMAILTSMMNDGKFRQLVDPTQALWNSVYADCSRWAQNSGSVFAIVFSSYLLGSLIRTLSSFVGPSRVANTGGIEFPDHGASSRDQGGESADLWHAQDYWKGVLCLNAPALFEKCQDEEARRRLFSSLFCAGLVGLVIAVGFMFEHGSSNLTWTSALLSVIVSVVFGMGLRIVRVEELRNSATLSWVYVNRESGKGKSEDES